jgi:cytochrome c2
MKPNFFWILAVAAALNLCIAESRAAEKVAEKADDASPGEALFSRKCALCHSLAEGKNGNGPTLYGIVNREAAVVPGFKYSRAMTAMAHDSGLEWNDENLAAFLAHPGHLVPGTRMAFPGIADEKDRTALIDWLKANSGPPSGKP